MSGTYDSVDWNFRWECCFFFALVLCLKVWNAFFMFQSCANFIVSDTFTFCVHGVCCLRDIRDKTFRSTLLYCIKAVCASYLRFPIIRRYIFGVEETIIHFFIQGMFLICSQSLAGIQASRYSYLISAKATHW